MAEIAIGIDLGTSNSCVAIKRGEAPEVLANEYGERTTASVVCIGTDGKITVGNAARANILHDPIRTISSAKRLIGRYYSSEEVKKAKAICAYGITEGENNGVVIQVDERKHTLPEVSAMVLGEMKEIAEKQLGQPVTKAVVTVPAFFNDNQRQATKDAGRIAGLEVLRILNEPTAAALAYGFGQGFNQRVAVWDLGGGTFDISVLEIGDDIFEVLATCGDTFLGGDDFDDRLIDLLADEFLSEHGISLRNNTFALERLKVASEGAKQALSSDSEVEIRIPDVIEGPDGESLSIERTLAVDDYEKLVRDLLQRTFAVCDEALRQAGVVARDLDGVILVGGPTRLPLVREAVATYFQQEPKTSVDPDEVVAMGAAIHASSLLNPENEAFLLDVTPLSLRIGVAGGLAETLIERNTPVPIEQTRRFTTFKDFQESVVIRVYQGEMRNAEENELLGQFEFSGFEKERRGEVSIDITFEINADGIVDVTAKDVKTGEEACTRITLSTGLSEGEIENIIERGRAEEEVMAAADIAPPEPRAEEVEKMIQQGIVEQKTGAPSNTAASAPPEQDMIVRPGDAVFDAAALEKSAKEGGVQPQESISEAASESPASAVKASGPPEDDLVPLASEDLEPEEFDSLDDLLDNPEDLEGTESDADLDATDPMLLGSEPEKLKDNLFDQSGQELTSEDNDKTES